MGDTRITEDPRIDPRIKALFGAVDISRSSDDVDSRQQILEEANTEEAIALRSLVTAFLGMADTEEVAPVDGIDGHRARRGVGSRRQQDQHPVHPARRR